MSIYSNGGKLHHDSEVHIPNSSPTWECQEAFSLACYPLLPVPDCAWARTRNRGQEVEDTVSVRVINPMQGESSINRKLWLSIITQHSALIGILRKVDLLPWQRGTN